MIYVYDAIFSQEEDGRYSVTVPDLPGCFTFGEDLQDAVRNTVEAIVLNIEDYIASEEEIPESIHGHTPEGDDIVFPVPAEVDPEYVSIGEPYMTTVEAGKLLKVTDSRVRQLYYGGTIEGRKLGRDLQIARWSVDEYRKGGTMQTADSKSSKIATSPFVARTDTKTKSADTLGLFERRLAVEHSGASRYALAA
ncbi:MAG: type II toxin-antitoxin system HicB family antitoxin [Coriobacteriia bacterium]|nr:type II toxin-antitoxin system HicB family antitoxin [Coriobacteriia bacterium]